VSTSGVTTTPAPVWSPLVTNANVDVYPSFAWTVPEYAAAGSRIWLQIEVNMGDSTTDTDDDTTPPSSYYGVFQVTVKATAPTTPPPPPADDAEVSSLLTTIAIVTAVTAIGFLCFYLFII
jgi:hypothetical protein